MRKFLARPYIWLPLATFLALALGGELVLRAAEKPTFLPPHPKALVKQPVWASMVHVRSSSPSLPYELNAGYEGVALGTRIKINSLGFRGDEPLAADTPRLTRIVAIGDSFTFGLGLDQDLDVPTQLEELLRAREPACGRAFDVVNCGVTGYDTTEEASLLRERAMALDPHVVIVGYSLNDPEDLPMQPLHAYFHRPSWWQHSNLLRSLAEKRRAWQIRQYGKGVYFDFLDAPDGPQWPRVAAAFDDIRAQCEQRGVPAVLVVFPMLSVKTWEEYDKTFGRIHEHVGREARARGFTVLDPCAALRVHSIADVTLSPADCHLNALGCRIVAEELEPLVRSLLDRHE